MLATKRVSDNHEIEDVNDAVAVEIGCCFPESVGDNDQIQDIDETIAVEVSHLARAFQVDLSV